MSIFGAFAGTLGGARITLEDANVDDITISPTNAGALYQLTNAGVIEKSTNSGGAETLGNWVFPASAAGSAYEVRATLNSGSVSSGTTGSWLSLGTTRTWAVNQTVVGIGTANLTIAIRNAASLAVLDSATVVITAEKAT